MLSRVGNCVTACDGATFVGDMTDNGNDERRHLTDQADYSTVGVDGYQTVCPSGSSEPRQLAPAVEVSRNRSPTTPPSSDDG